MKKTRTSVTINIPTYNQELYISHAIQSALEQTYDNLHINVLDDASSDNTFKVALSFSNNRLKVNKNESNQGRVKTYRKLFQQAQSEWIVNLDGDDFFSNINFIAEGIKWISNLGDDVVFFQANHVNLKAVAKLSTAVKLADDTYVADGIDYLTHYNNIKSFDHFATLYNKNIAINCGFYEFDSLNTDFNSIMKLCFHGKVILSGMKIGSWNLNLQSETNKIFNQDNYEKYLDAVSDLTNYGIQYIGSENAKILNKKLLSLTKGYLFMLAADRGDMKNAKKVLVSNLNFSMSFIRNLLKYLKLAVFSLFKSK